MQYQPYQPSLFDQAPMTVPIQANTDEKLLKLWLHNRGHNTASNYERVARAFLEGYGPLRTLTIGGLQAWYDSLEGTQGSKNVYLSTIKSLLTYGHKIGYLPVNVGLVMKTKGTHNDLIKRIVDEDVIHEIMGAAKTPLDVALVRLLYVSGLRTSEVVNLTWKDCIRTPDGVILSVFGKGDKSRNILIDFETFRLMKAQANEGSEWVFTSQKGCQFNRTSLWRRVKNIVANIKPEFSTHWFRHAHASHSLDNSAPLTRVTENLGHKSALTTSKYLHAKPGEQTGKYLKLDK